MMHCHPHDQQGFTLTEVLVSLTIFLITSLGLLPLLLGGMYAGPRNALHGEARRLSGEAMAALQVADYAALPAFDGLPSRHGPIVVERLVESDTPAAGQFRLTVTARWEAAGQGHRYQVQSIRSEP
jgi:prepilin-type N-terminal cleavage/methylation domain-containing protein